MKETRFFSAYNVESGVAPVRLKEKSGEKMKDRQSQKVE